MKTSMRAVEAFLKERTLAVVGVSRTATEFSHVVYRTLKERGYTVYPVNPFAQKIDGDPCAPDIRSVPGRVGGAVVFVRPEKTEGVVRELVAAGIRQIWIQQGAETPAAVEYCREEGANVVAGQCLLMFLEPVGFPHRLHRWIKTVTRTIPA